MTANFTIEEILNLKGARFLGKSEELKKLDGERFVVLTDSREDMHESGKVGLYLALNGERFDGHSFVQEALSKTEVFRLALCEERFSDELKLRHDQIVFVPESRKAYQELARLYRLKSKARVIGITGSSGKTTTKEMFATVLSHRFKTHKSQANENNEIGVPKTILAMPEGSEVLIVEMGMRGVGQILELAEIALPEIAVITSIGTAHIELLGSRENIARAKCELLQCLDADKGLAILGCDDELSLAVAREAYGGPLIVVSKESAQIVKVDSAGTYFRLNDSMTVFFVAVHGEYLLQDACLTIEACRALDMTDELIAEGLREFKPVEGRGKPVVLSSGAVIIDETYNANPDSMRCAVQSVVSSANYTHLPKVLILGKMAELGEHTEVLHEELGQWLSKQPVQRLITIGSVASQIAGGAKSAPYIVQEVEDQDEAFELVKDLLNQPVCVVIKGSHSAQLDKLVFRLVESLSMRI